GGLARWKHFGDQDDRTDVDAALTQANYQAAAEQQGQRTAERNPSAAEDHQQRADRDGGALSNTVAERANDQQGDQRAEEKHSDDAANSAERAGVVDGELFEGSAEHRADAAERNEIQA